MSVDIKLEDNKSDEDQDDQEESWLDRLQHEKHLHTQSIEIFHQRRPTREELVQSGIIKPRTPKPGGFALDLIIDDVMVDVKQRQDKIKKRKMEQYAIKHDDHGESWDEYGDTKEKSKTAPKSTKTEPKTMETEDKSNNNNNTPLQLTTNNLTKHNFRYSINNQIIMNKFIEFNEDEDDNDQKKNKNKSNNKESKKNKRVKAPKLAKKKSVDKKSKINMNNQLNKDLKQWMVKNSVWDNALYTYFVVNHVLSLADLLALKQDKFDRIIRKFRVEKIAKVRDKHSRKHIDKVLIKMEKAWKKTKKKKKKKSKK